MVRGLCRELQYVLDDAQVAVLLTTPEHEAAMAPLARQAGADLRLLQPQACARATLSLTRWAQCG